MASVPFTYPPQKNNHFRQRHDTSTGHKSRATIDGNQNKVVIKPENSNSLPPSRTSPDVVAAEPAPDPESHRWPEREEEEGNQYVDIYGEEPTQRIAQHEKHGRPSQTKQASNHYQLIDDRLSSLEEKSNQTKQTSDSYQLIEDRLSSLEEKFKKLSAENRSTFDSAADPETQEGSARFSAIDFEESKAMGPPKINRMMMHEYQNSDSRIDIDVLIDEPIELKSDRAIINRFSNIATNSLVLFRPNNAIPSRIHIRSKVLREFLAEIFHIESMSSKGEIIAPFKPLFLYEAKIRERFNLLKSKVTELKDAEVEASYSTTPKSSRTPAAFSSYGATEISNPNFATVGEQKLDENDKRHGIELLCDLLGCLIEFIDRDLAPLLRLRREIETGTLSEIAFEDLWHLFKPGDTIYTNESGDPNNFLAFRVLNVTGGRQLLQQSSDDSTSYRRPDDDMSPCIIDCYYFDFDGKTFGAIQKNFMISKYDGKKPVTSLDIFPARFREDAQTIRNNLLVRAEKFMKLSTPNKFHHMYCGGLSLDERQVEINSKVIVDCYRAALGQSYKDQMEKTDLEKVSTPKLGLIGQTEGNIYELTVTEAKSDTCPCASCVGKEFAKQGILNDHVFDRQQSQEFLKTNPLLFARNILAKDLREQDRELLPFKVFGFVLRTRKWASMNIADLEEPKNKNSIESLILTDNQDEIIKSLVQTHDQAHEADTIEGKGKGLIILLHGAPGVGKTLTAESIAELTGHPLFPITCGDIGTNAYDVEVNLTKNFQLAHAWKCVLLLDEADVFLSKRHNADMEQNSIVSVFLRLLEYYAGILFLTTNRIGSFDDAFKSRIHMSLYYPPLTSESNKKIWKYNIKHTRETIGAEMIQIDDRSILDFATRYFESHPVIDTKTRKVISGPWNGRQIRNAFQTAVALARWDRRVKQEKVIEKGEAREVKLKLKTKHFERVVQAATDFDKYINMVHGGQGHDEAQRAAQRGERRDNFVRGASGEIVEAGGLGPIDGYKLKKGEGKVGGQQVNQVVGNRMARDKDSSDDSDSDS